MTRKQRDRLTKAFGIIFMLAMLLSIVGSSLFYLI